jgi:hypothetical protein
MLNVEEAGAIDVEELYAVDPLLSKVEMPLQSTLFPLGFPLKLSTNSPAVLEAADISWGQFKQKFSHPPLELRIGVTKGGNTADLPPVPVVRMQWSQLINIADANNFITIDFKAGRSFGWVTQALAESPRYLRYYLLDSAALGMVSGLRAGCLHAACVAPYGRGMLLCGNMGAGKSTLAYAGARTGWPLICDDASFMPLDRDDRLVVGNYHRIRFRSAAVELFPEFEGRPVTPRVAGNKPAIEVATSELPGITTADSAVVDYLIFLNRNWTGDPELAPISREVVLPWLKRSLTYTAVNAQAVQDDVLRRLFDAKVFELRYQDLNWAIERLNRLAQRGS